MANWARYLTLEAAKREVKIEDVLDDETITRAIIAASGLMPRQFFVQTGVRTFSPTCGDHVLLGPNDLLAVTSLKTDDATRTYPYTWGVGEYDLDPDYAPTLTPPRPYWKISRVSGSTYSFPVASRGLQVTGRWGFYDVRRDAGAVIAMPAPISPPGLSISATTLVVSAATIETGHTLRIGTEDLFVTAVNLTSLTVEREVNGTTAAVHADGAAIEIYTYPQVDEAVVIMMERLVRRTRDAPFGVIGSIDGFMRLAINDPDVVSLLRFAERANY
jgi:hypothetical protein